MVWLVCNSLYKHLLFLSTEWLLVTAAVMFLRYPSSCSEKAAVKLGGAAAAPENDGTEAVVMSWMATAEFTLQNMLPRFPVTRCLRLTVLWAPRDYVFHLSQFFL